MTAGEPGQEALLLAKTATVTHGWMPGRGRPSGESGELDQEL